MPPRCQLLSGSLPRPQILLRRSPPSPHAFSTSSALYKHPLARRHGGDLGVHLPKHIIPKDADIPEYPYGPQLLFKQSNRGLYGGQRIQFGNNVSPETETKTRRHWKPNVLSKSLYSVALKKRIKLRVTAKVMKTIDREGGLDEYLLKQSEHRIKELGPMGWALRWTLLQRPEVVARMRADAAALGVPQKDIDEQWPDPAAAAAEQIAKEAAVDAVEALTTDCQEDVEGVPNSMSHTAGKEANAARARIVHQERTIKRQADAEYAKAIAAAKRYVARGLVDAKEDGIKLAFIRARERAELRRLTRTRFEQKIEALFGPSKDKAEFDTKVKAYEKRRNEQIAAAGGYKAWRDQSLNPESAAKHAAEVENAGGREAWEAQRKAELAKKIAEAERVQGNLSLPQEERNFLETALKKAYRAIEATKSSGRPAYIEATLAEWRERNADRLAASKLSETPVLDAEPGEQGDAWGALIGLTQPGSHARPRT